MRRAASQLPRKSPWDFSTASAYDEQLGVKRQRGPISGEMKRLYSRIRPTAGHAATWPTRASGPGPAAGSIRTSGCVNADPRSTEIR